MPYTPTPFVTTSVITPTTKFSQYPVEINKMMLDSGSYLAAQVALLSAQYSSNTGYTAATLDWKMSAMSKAQFNALASERRANRAGSGFDEWGKHISIVGTNVNEGIYCDAALANKFYIGRGTDGIGISKTSYPMCSINGIALILNNINNPTNSVYNLNQIALPTAPTILPFGTVLTAEQIASGVVTHASADSSGLIVNGKFGTDTSGWAIGYSSAISVDTNRLKITNSLAYGYAYQVVPTVVGKKYIAECFSTLGTATRNVLGIGATVSNAITGVLGIDISTTGGYQKVEFTATTTTTYIAVGIDASATSTVYVDNIAVFPADAISRQDFVYLKVNDVSVVGTDYLYPLGNGQYLGADTDGITGISTGAQSSVFGSWQTAWYGKGYVWSTRTDAQKQAIIANPENNAYLNGSDVRQKKYVVQVAMMKGDNFTEATAFASLGYTQDATDKGLWTHADGSQSISIALVHRRNQGFYHPTYNPNGTKIASDGLKWYNTTVSFTSISDCFDPSKLTTASGYIGTTSGRSDGLFFDQIDEGSITDLRNSSQKVEDYNRLIDREFNKAVTGTVRGTEGEATLVKTMIEVGIQHSGQTYFDIPLDFISSSYDIGSIGGNKTVGYVVGNNGAIYSIEVQSFISVARTIARLNASYGNVTSNLSNGNDVYVYRPATRTKSNTLTHTDIIGSPANYPTSWKQSGVSGTPLIVGENGENYLDTVTYGTLSTIKLSRKCTKSTVDILYTTDAGATWNIVTGRTVDQVNNVVSSGLSTAGTTVYMVTYQTHTNMATPTVNSEVLAIGTTEGFNGATFGQYLQASLIGKVPVNVTSSYFNVVSWIVAPQVFTSGVITNGVTYPPIHNSISLAGGTVSSPAVKVFPYLTRSNGKAYLNLVFKEMKYGSYAAPTVDAGASISHVQYATYKVSIAGCPLDGEIVQWTAATATAAINWALYNKNADGSLYVISSGAVYANAKLFDGNSWGDDSKFNIVDNVSTTVDDNGATVLIGQKTIPLPYFIGSAE